jgi:hypothetical protein
MKIVNSQKVVAACSLDQSTMSHPRAFVSDIKTAVAVRPLGRW